MYKKHKYYILYIFIFFFFCSQGYPFSLELEGNTDYDFIQPTDLILLKTEVPFLDGKLIASGGFKRDNIITPPYSDILLNNYWFWNEGYLFYQKENFITEIGLKQNSIGPGNIYKLFIDNNSGFSYPTINFIVLVGDGKIKLENLWGGLRLYDGVKPTKSFNYRSISFSPSKNFEIGYEESILYLDRYFDSFYFFAPLPMPAIQEAFHMGNAPWYSNFDDNSLIGGWLKYSIKNTDIYIEILVDDINMNRFLRPSDPHQNPDKLAFLTGISSKKEPFRITFEFAGATAFVFQRTHANKPYEYIMFENSNLPIERNMIGYKHGENNLAYALRIEYDDKKWFGQIDYEYLLYGTRTPEEPWHGGQMPNGTQWLIGDLNSNSLLTFLIERRFENLTSYIKEFDIGINVGFSQNKSLIGIEFNIVF